jgi:fibronectin type 3 domain-containing protein
MRTRGCGALLRGCGAAAMLGSLVVVASCSNLFPTTPTTPTTPPSGASGVIASDGVGVGKVVVSWSPASGATSYKIYRATSSEGTYTLQATVGELTAWEDTAAAVGVHYWYSVAACNAAGCSSQSAADEGYISSDPPGVPTSVGATDGVSADTISVSWETASGATSYHIYRADMAGGMYALRATAAVPPWEDDSLLANVHHWYKVAACNVAGCSPQSTEDEGYTSIAAPAAPSWVIATDGPYVDRIGVRWSPVTGATGYQIYRASSFGGEYLLLTSVTETTSYDDTGLQPDAHFWYKVAACNSAGCSPMSAYTGQGYTSAVVPAAPAWVVATDGTYASRVGVSWSPVTGATSYHIYRASPPDTSFFYQASVLGGGVTSWTDRDVPPGTTYRYRVSACNGVGCGDPSPDDVGSTSL